MIFSECIWIDKTRNVVYFYIICYLKDKVMVKTFCIFINWITETEKLKNAHPTKPFIYYLSQNIDHKFHFRCIRKIFWYSRFIVQGCKDLSYFPSTMWFNCFFWLYDYVIRIDAKLILLICLQKCVVQKLRQIYFL